MGRQGRQRPFGAVAGRAHAEPKSPEHHAARRRRGVRGAGRIDLRRQPRACDAERGQLSDCRRRARQAQRPERRARRSRDADPAERRTGDADSVRQRLRRGDHAADRRVRGKARQRFFTMVGFLFYCCRACPPRLGHAKSRTQPR